MRLKHRQHPWTSCCCCRGTHKRETCNNVVTPFYMHFNKSFFVYCNCKSVTQLRSKIWQKHKAFCFCFVLFLSFFFFQLLIIVHHSAKTISILQELHAFIDLGEGQFVGNVVIQIDCLNPTQRKQRLSMIVLYYVFLVQRSTTSLHVAVVNQTALELYMCVCVCVCVELRVSFEFVTKKRGILISYPIHVFLNQTRQICSSFVSSKQSRSPGATIQKSAGMECHVVLISCEP